MKIFPWSNTKFRNSFLIWIATISGISLFTTAPIPLLSENSALITAVALLYVPTIYFLITKQKIDYVDWNTLAFFKKAVWGVGIALIILCIVSLPIFFIDSISFRYPLPENFWDYALIQFFMVALPEEFFFRGWLQTRLNQVWGRPWKILGVKMGPASIFVSILFVLSHSLITLQTWHLLIFFPSLIFAWAFEKYQTITPSWMVHGFFNIWIFCVSHSLF